MTITVNNKGTTSHGLDTHAFKIDARHYGPTAPGTTLTLEKVVDTPGVFMYHCAAGPVTDLHIKSGIHGAMRPMPSASRGSIAKRGRSPHSVTRTSQQSTESRKAAARQRW